jgi:hypothetical protein
MASGPTGAQSDRVEHAPPGSWADGLVLALRRLDQRLKQAADVAHEAFGPDAAADPYRGLYINQGDVVRLLEREPGRPVFPPPGPGEKSILGTLEEGSRLAWLAKAYGLPAFDMDVVLIALAPEVDLRYERLYAYLQDDVSRKRPSVDLVLNLLCGSASEKLARRLRFAADSALVRQDVVHLVADPAGSPLLSHALRLDDQIVRLLLRQPGLDSRLARYARMIRPAPLPASAAAAGGALPGPALARLCAEVRNRQGSLCLQFQGVRGAGQFEAAEALAACLGAPLLAFDLDSAPAADAEFEAVLKVLLREARFRDAVLYLEPLDALTGTDRSAASRHLRATLADQGGVTVLAGASAWAPPGGGRLGVLTIPFPVPESPARGVLWGDRLATAGVAVDGDGLDALADRFRLTPAQIDSAVANATVRSRWRETLRGACEGAPGPTLGELFDAARNESGHDLGELARKVEPVHTWERIVLPDDGLEQLDALCRQVKRRRTVLDDWGFGRAMGRGKGVNALFFGPPGTGKTTAAEVIANELGLDLYQIDLARVVSKYIGETEKMLARLFDAAQDANAILFFDEADALFGKRSEVRDSHDRYANLEIAYLLQKIEQYEGVAVLATNLRQNMDESFLRRLQFVVEFPFPDEPAREQIWRVHFPGEAPRDATIDFGFLAKRLRVAGGDIKNIVLGAAFLAAGDGQPIGMSHLIRAARREYQKLGKLLGPAELGPYAAE